MPLPPARACREHIHSPRIGLEALRPGQWLRTGAVHLNRNSKKWCRVAAYAG